MARTPSKLSRAISEPVMPVVPAKKRAIDYDLLTDEDKARLRAEAQSKINERAKLEAEKAYLSAQIEEIEREKYPEIFEERFDICLDLAIYAPHVELDGKRYMHGGRYTVPRSVYMVLKDQEQWTKRHVESLRSGDDYNSAYRRERNLASGVKNDPNSIQMSARGGVTAGGQPVSMRTHF